MKRLLIVEDEYWTRKRLVSAVDWEKAGFSEVAEAETGQDAMEKIAGREPNLIITDIQMPKVSGLELLKWLRERNCQIPVIILSGYSEFEYARQAVRLGASDYLLKPIEEIALLESVKNCMGSPQELPDEELTPAASHKVVKEAIEYVEKHYEQAFTMQDVAAHVYLSPTYFCRIFREDVGYTFTEYLQRYRAKKACELLESSDLTIAEIACRCGVPDIKYFYKIFKKHYKMTPAEYRKKKERQQ